MLIQLVELQVILKQKLLPPHRVHQHLILQLEVTRKKLIYLGQNLEAEVKANHFREDLYFRLAVVKMALPPLRQRGGDVTQLAEHLVLAFSKELKKAPKKFSKAALEAIRRHDWPGNVRELQNRVKRAIVLADGPTIGPSELELEQPNGNAVSSASTLKEAKEALEREILENALHENKGNISKTAKSLGISRPTLYDLMARYEL